MPERFLCVDTALDRARVLAFQYRKIAYIVMLLRPFGVFVFVGPEGQFPDYLQGCEVLAVFSPE
jgi:hypothetical protein